MPSPRPINRHSPRSFLVPCERRGNQPSGTEIVRPSLRSTVRVSAVVRTSVAAGTMISRFEITIPGLHQRFVKSVENFIDPSQFYPGKTSSALQPYGIEPEFRHVAIPFYVDVRSLVPISGIDEDPIRTVTQDCGHRVLPFAYTTSFDTLKSRGLRS